MYICTKVVQKVEKKIYKFFAFMMILYVSVYLYRQTHHIGYEKATLLPVGTVQASDGGYIRPSAGGYCFCSWTRTSMSPLMCWCAAQSTQSHNLIFLLNWTAHCDKETHSSSKPVQYFFQVFVSWFPCCFPYQLLL